MVSNEGVGDAVRDGLRGANHSNSLAIARICNDADRPRPRPHTHEEIVNTFLGAVIGVDRHVVVAEIAGPHRLAGLAGMGRAVALAHLGGQRFDCGRGGTGWQPLRTCSRSPHGCAGAASGGLRRCKSSQ